MVERGVHDRECEASRVPPSPAPREDRSIFVEPPFDEVSELADANGRLRGSYRYDFRGRTLEALGRQAREELVAEASALRLPTVMSTYRPSRRAGQSILPGINRSFFIRGCGSRTSHWGCSHGSVAPSPST